jgi:hypothetical protein
MTVRMGEPGFFTQLTTQHVSFNDIMRLRLVRSMVFTKAPRP